MANVLIDTQIFRAHGFNFDRQDFTTLSELIAAGKIQLFLTRVIDREVQRQITEEAVTAKQALRKVMKEHSVLRHAPQVPFGTLVAKDALSELTAIRLKQWNDWKEKNAVVQLPVQAIDVNSIIDAYFDSKPPFGAGAKKAEFPDAISLAAVAHWASENNADVIVASGDGDLERFCAAHPRLNHAPSLASLLERFTEPYIVQAVLDRLRAIEGDIIAWAKEQFEGLEFILDGEDGDVHAVTVTHASVEDMHVIEAKDGQGVAEITMQVQFTAEVAYEDPTSGIYDSEDKVMLFRENIETKLDGDDEAVLTVEFNYDEDDPGEVQTVDFRIDDRTRYVSVPDSY